MKLSLWLSKHVSKTAGKYSSAVIALLCVWLANGLWHGPSWTYVGYGLYYFVLMVVELFFEKPFEAWADRHPKFPLKTLRFIKLLIIVMYRGDVLPGSFFHAWLEDAYEHDFQHECKGRRKNAQGTGHGFL